MSINKQTTEEPSGILYILIIFLVFEKFQYMISSGFDVLIIHVYIILIHYLSGMMELK